MSTGGQIVKAHSQIDGNPKTIKFVAVFIQSGLLLLLSRGRHLVFLFCNWQLYRIGIKATLPSTFLSSITELKGESCHGRRMQIEFGKKKV